MIVPLPQHPALSGIVERSSKDAGKPSESFGAMIAAPAAPVQRPLARVFPDHGPAIMPVIDPATGPALTDPGEFAPAPLEAQPNARVFNRDGFFGRAIDCPEGAVVAPAVGSEIVDAQPDASGSRPDPGGAAPAPLAEIASARAVRVSGVEADARPVGRARVPGQAGMTGATRAIVSEPVSEILEDAQVPVALRRQVRESRTARTAVHVALHELEQGVRVAVRLDALDRAERDALRNEITALLAQHGLSPRTIRIFAPLERNFPDGSTK